MIRRMAKGITTMAGTRSRLSAGTAVKPLSDAVDHASQASVRYRCQAAVSHPRYRYVCLSSQTGGRSTLERLTPVVRASHCASPKQLKRCCPSLQSA